VPRLDREDGLALPLTILVVTLVTIMLAALFTRVQSDRRLAESSGDNVDALSIAQSGLQSYFGATVSWDQCRKPIRPLDGDSVRINVTGGYADVVANVVQKPADTLDTWMYVVRSTGYVIEPTMGADPQAVRTVAQFAEWNPGDITMLAAFTVANGLVKNVKGKGEFRGVDQHWRASCRQPDIAAMRVPNGGAPNLPGSYVTTGSTPNILVADNSGTVAAMTGIDWATTITGGIVPDYTYVKFWDSSYPVMLVAGDTTLSISSNKTGYGTMIVTGDLTFTGNRKFQWYGIVLVGGEIIFNSRRVYFDGIVVSGLNAQLTGSPPKKGALAAASNRTVDMDYNSWYVARAMQAFAGFAPIENAWIDNWASY
jgi:type II secretory pathway pseudopilin PulG